MWKRKQKAYPLCCRFFTDGATGLGCAGGGSFAFRGVAGGGSLAFRGCAGGGSLAFRGSTAVYMHNEFSQTREVGKEAISSQRLRDLYLVLRRRELDLWSPSH